MWITSGEVKRYFMEDYCEGFLKMISPDKWMILCDDGEEMELKIGKPLQIRIKNQWIETNLGINEVGRAGPTDEGLYIYQGQKARARRRL